MPLSDNAFIATENMFELMCYLLRFPGDDGKHENPKDMEALASQRWISMSEKGGWSLSEAGSLALRLLYGDSITGGQGLVLLSILKFHAPIDCTVNDIQHCYAHGWIWTGANKCDIIENPTELLWTFTAQGLKIAQAIETRNEMDDLKARLASGVPYEIFGTNLKSA